MDTVVKPRYDSTPN
ncbi:MAG TPA: hypothetical protein LFW20_00125 [Rickettsia endosymbiont of Omalisus fontisbellaquei]|nr:hypothetical protein [Rickettsia endosymbiont of Omalisus fontisbellaquei]